VPAFVGGGFLPASARGRNLTGYIHAADWYLLRPFDIGTTACQTKNPCVVATFWTTKFQLFLIYIIPRGRFQTFCLLAGGLDCQEAENPSVKKGAVPAVDGYNIYPYIAGDLAVSPRAHKTPSFFACRFLASEKSIVCQARLRTQKRKKTQQIKTFWGCSFLVGTEIMLDSQCYAPGSCVNGSAGKKSARTNTSLSLSLLFYNVLKTIPSVLSREPVFEKNKLSSFSH
jgi:hypothetical protein